MSYQYSYGPGGGSGAGGGGGGGYGAPSGGYGGGGGGGGGGYGAPGGGPPPAHGGGYGAPGGAPHSSAYGSAPPSGGAGGGGGGHYGASSSPYPPSSYGGSRPQAYTSHSGPPPGADPQLWTWFVSVDRDGSGHINPVELQQALVNGDWTPFELDTVKLLMTIFDTDRSGAITYNEFVGLWKYIQDWQGVFRHFDADRSGSIDQGELARALANFGYNLNPHLLSTVVHKFGECAR